MKRKLTPARKARTRVCSFGQQEKIPCRQIMKERKQRSKWNRRKKNASDFLPCPIRREHGKGKEKASRSQAIVHWEKGFYFFPFATKKNYLWRK